VVQLPRDPAAVAVARRHAVGLCHDVVSEERCADVALVVSELVTNAIRYGREPLSLTVRPVRDGSSDAIRIEVTDADPTPLAPVEPPGELSLGRRGLVLVAGMSRRWGSQPIAGGKLVWCEL
jgi:anti-sigma regulatory factor (Ser/Thr protein kinase)